MEGHSLSKAILYMIVASFCFALTGAIAKFLGNEISSIQLVFYRNVIGLIPLAYIFYHEPVVKKQSGRLSLLIFRGFIGTMALYFFFYGVTTIGLAESITYQQSYPIFLALVSMLLLKNKLSQNAWFAILIGFGGLCFIFVPKVSENFLALKSQLIGLSNMIMTGMAYLSIRGLSNYYDNKQIVLSFILCGILFPLISMVIGEFYTHADLAFLIAQFQNPKPEQLFPILFLGTAAFIGQVYLTKAFTHPNTGMVGAVGYSNIVFSIIFGVLLGETFPGLLALIGICLIIMSGIIIGFESKK